MTWKENLPDTASWQPQPRRLNLKNALMVTCQTAQAHITARTDAEIKFNIHNFDSGSGVEDIVRDELAILLPQRYVVDFGVVDDSEGNTAGDCDIIVRDNLWSNVIKPGATNQSRRKHSPIESLYAAIEVKQTMGFSDLDAAMEKLVKISRLQRDDNPYGHITENQHIHNFDRLGAILNPLHTTVFATRMKEGLSFHEIAERFGEINRSLNRTEMVKMLCILENGTAWYSVESGTPYDATYMADRQCPLILQVNHQEPENAFYRFYTLLMRHLTRSVLNFATLSHQYGTPPPERDVLSYEDAEFNQGLNA